MAKRLNKNLVMVLTVLGMVAITAACVAMIWLMPERDPERYLQQAAAFREAGDYMKAARAYVNAQRASDDEGEDYRIEAGDMLIKAGDARRAMRMWMDVMVDNPKNEEAQLKILTFQKELADLPGNAPSVDEWSEIERVARRLLEINPDNLEAKNALGRALVGTRTVDAGRAAEGEKYLREAVEGDPSDPEYARHLANYYLTSSREMEQKNQDREARELREKAIAVMETLEANSSDDPEEMVDSYRHRGEFFRELKGHAYAELIQHRIRSAGGDPPALVEQIKVYDNKAAEYLSEAVRLAEENGSQDVEPVIALGLYYFNNRSLDRSEEVRQEQMKSDWEKAVEYYQRAIEKDPQSFVPYFALAELRTRQNQPEKAYEVLKQRLELPIKRDHYLSGLNRNYMAIARRAAFNKLMDQAWALPKTRTVLAEQDEELDRIKGLMQDLYNESKAEAASGEQDPGVLFMKGRLLLLDGKYAEAIEALKEADKLTPGIELNLKRTLAYTYTQQSLPNLALRELDEILQIDRANVTALAMKAKLLAELDQPEQALEAAAIALRQAPDNITALTAKRAALLDLGSTQEAKRVTDQLARAVGASPVQQKLQEAMMILLEAQQKAEEDDSSSQGISPELEGKAIALLKEVLEEDRLNQLAMRQLVLLALQNPQRYEEVRDVLDRTQDYAEKMLAEKGESITTEEGREINFRRVIEGANRLKLALDPDVPDDEKFEGVVELVKLEKDELTREMELFALYRRTPDMNEKAFTHLHNAYELKPESPVLVDQLFALALELEKWDLAERLIDEAVDLQLDPSGGYFYRGRLFLAQTEMEDHARKAIEQFRTGLNATSSYQDGYVYLGQALMLVKDYNGAEEAFMKAREMNANNPMAAYRLLQLAGIREDEAQILRWLEVCERLIPNSPLVVQMRQNMQDLRDPEEGIADRERKREENPEDVENLAQLARLYARVGRLDKAEEISQEAMEIDANNLRVVSAYSGLLSMKRPPEYEKAIQLLESYIEGTEPDQKTERAAAQLSVAVHLRNSASQPDSEVTMEQVNAAFTKAADYHDLSTVCLDIANHFRRTRQVEEALTWYRRTVELAEAEQREEMELQAREALIRTMLVHEEQRLRTEGMKRGEQVGLDVEKEIAALRRRFPTAPVIHLLQAELSVIRAHEPEAINHLTAYIQSVTEPAPAYFRRGQLYLRSSQWEKAISDLEALKRIDPAYSSFNGRLLLALGYEESGEISRALDELQSIVESDRNHERALRALFALLISEESYPRARSLAERRALEQPRSPLWRSYLSQVASAQGQADAAIDNARKAVELSDFHPGACDDLIGMYMKFNRYDALVSFIDDELPDPMKRAAVLLMKGSALAAKGEMDKAIEAYLASFEARRFTPDAVAMRLSADVKERIEGTALVKAIEAHVQSNPENRQARLLLGIARHEAAYQLRESGNKTDGQAMLDQVIALFTDMLNTSGTETPYQRMEKNFLLKRLARYRLDAKQYDECRRLYEQALKIAPEDVETLNNLAFVLIDYFDSPEKALPYAQKALDIVPNNPSVMDTVGWCLILMGNYDQGIAAVRKSIEGVPQMAEVHYHAAVGFHRRSRVEGNPSASQDRAEAVAEIERAHELIMKKGEDPANVLDEIVELGEELGIPLKDQLPERPAA